MTHRPLLVAILGALAGCSETFEGTGCMEVPAEQLTCAPENQVSPSELYLPGKCGDLEIVEVLGAGTREDLPTEAAVEKTPACCYPVKVINHDPGTHCEVGRPYFEDGKALSAPLLAEDTGRALPRRALAWANAGRAEHASVAAFGRLLLQLLRHGAPSALLRDVQQAGIDEVGHSELCWSLARHFGGGQTRAGEFPFAGKVDADISLAELADAAVVEGCLAETLGAHVAQAAAELAPEPNVRAVLASIAAEEATHAVLSFRIVAWALASGGPAVKAAVRAALGRPWPALDVDELALRAGVDVAELSAAARQGVTEVLEPAVARLLVS